MRNIRRFIVLLLCLSLVCAFPLSAKAASSGIIMINNSRDLLKLAENCRLDTYSQDLTVLLAADIDLTGIAFSPIPVFSGVLKGNGYHITGLTLETSGSYQGFFRSLTDSAVVTNLHIEATVIPGGSAGTIGGIAGQNAGQIINCTFTGSVSGVDYVGGIAGINTLTGVVDSCSVRGSIHGKHFVGGIAGQNAGVIRGCTNYAAVNTTVEQNSVQLEDITLDSIVSSEYAATITDIGGICGTGSGVIRGCHNRGTVGYPQIGYNIGGIAGSFCGYISDCSNHGSVYGRKEIGGILGQLEPVIHINYDEDAIQELQSQVGTMSGTAGSVGNHIQNGVNALDNFSTQLEKYLSDVQNALYLLIPDPENPQMPDKDTLEAVKSTLSGSLSGLTNAVNAAVSSGVAAFEGLSLDLQALTQQMNAIGGTIGTAAENLGGSITDISDLDNAESFTAKIDSCRNLGSVEGDWNVGGIVGAMASENDLDPESDLQLVGTMSLNFDVQMRAVVRDCDNEGLVRGKKQNIGGIVGWSSLGLIRHCINTAQVEAAGADYVGGIAGQSQGYIRACSAKCSIVGDKYIGGIAGIGYTVSDCRTIVHLDGQSEKYGAILGIMDNAIPSSNYYLVSGANYGAVDGISYAGKAEGLDSTQFFGLEGLPGVFRLVIVSFVFEDGIVQRYTLPYGSSLKAIDFPEIPTAEGSDARWESSAGNIDPVDRDLSFHIVRSGHLYTLQASLTGRNDLPVLLLQGEFSQGAVFDAVNMNDAGYPNAWRLTIPDSKAPLTIRCLLPDGFTGDTAAVQIRLRDGSWQDTPFRVDGSYLVISVPNGVSALRLLTADSNTNIYLYLGGAILLLLAALTVVLVIRKKKKK